MPAVDISLQLPSLAIGVGADVLGLGVSVTINLGGTQPTNASPPPPVASGSSSPPGGSNNGGTQPGNSNSGTASPGSNSNSNSNGSSTPTSNGTSPSSGINSSSNPEQSGSSKTNSPGSSTDGTSSTSAADNDQSPGGNGASGSSSGGVANTGGSPNGHAGTGGSITGQVGPNGQPVDPSGNNGSLLPGSGGPHTNAGAIAGGGVGVLILLVIAGFFFFRRRRRRQREEEAIANLEKRFSIISTRSADAPSLSATSSQGLMPQPAASTSRSHNRTFLPGWMTKWRRTSNSPKSSRRSSAVPTLSSVDTSASSWNLLQPQEQTYPTSLHSRSSSRYSGQDEGRSVSENTNIHSDETASTTILFAQPVVNSNQLPPTNHSNSSRTSLSEQYIPAPATNADVGGPKWVDSFQTKATRKTFFKHAQPFRIPEIEK